MKRCARIIVGVGAALIALTLSACENPNNTEYRVLDRFQLAENFKVKPGQPEPPGRRFIWVKAWGTEKQKEPKAKDIYIDKELWATCWMGDKYTIRKIGKDTCERTPESKEPTSERMKHDPELRKKMEESERRIKERMEKTTASPTPSTGAHTRPPTSTEGESE